MVEVLQVLVPSAVLGGVSVKIPEHIRYQDQKLAFYYLLYCTPKADLMRSLIRLISQKTI